MRATVQELTNRLKEKESVINDLSEQRAKLENYTKKTLHAVQTKYMVAVSSHRNQINEKQERVEFLEKKLKEMRNSYSREQALMMSALYEVGAEMQRRTMLPVQIQGSGPNSYAPTAWLANKRSEERARRRNL
jgi:chromosome segregation ATPase